MLLWIGVYFFVMNLKNIYFSFLFLVVGVFMIIDLIWIGIEGSVFLLEFSISENFRFLFGFLSSVIVLMV